MFCGVVGLTPIHALPFQPFRLAARSSRVYFVAAAAPIPAPRASGPALFQMMMENRQQPLTINPRSGAMAANATILGQVMRIGEPFNRRRSVGLEARKKQVSARRSLSTGMTRVCGMGFATSSTQNKPFLSPSTDGSFAHGCVSTLSWFTLHAELLFRGFPVGIFRTD